MRKRRSFLLTSITLFILVFFLTGCETMNGQARTAALTPQSVQGRYQGYLPCADCPGIEYTLVLRADGIYRQSSFYTDRSEQPAVETGAYTIDDGSVILDKSGAGMKYFTAHPNGLQML
ncbi:MAG: copper resistance protein NlpE, partial [Desulfosarcina sp.]